MTKAAHAEVQNSPNANKNGQNGPKLKWPKVMSRTARVVNTARKITSLHV